MSTVTSPPRPTPLGGLGHPLHFAVLVAAVLAAIAVSFAVRVPAKIDRVEIRNPHRWPVTVEVGDVPGGHALGLGSVEPVEAQTFEEVIDQGDTWVFRFSYASVEVERSVPRAELARNRWQITVPEEFAARLEAAGVAPSGG